MPLSIIIVAGAGESSPTRARSRTTTLRLPPRPPQRHAPRKNHPIGRTSSPAHAPETSRATDFFYSDRCQTASVGVDRSRSAPIWCSRLSSGDQCCLSACITTRFPCATASWTVARVAALLSHLRAGLRLQHGPCRLLAQPVRAGQIIAPKPFGQASDGKAIRRQGSSDCGTAFSSGELTSFAVSLVTRLTETTVRLGSRTKFRTAHAEAPSARARCVVRLANCVVAGGGFRVWRGRRG